MAQFFYLSFLWLYRISAELLAFFSPKVKKWVEGRRNWQDQWRKKIAVSPPSGEQPIVWLHASSLGEFEQGSPLLDAIKQQWPDTYFVVTFFSPSGYEVRKNHPIANVSGYLPFDHPSNGSKFVSLIHPDLVLWVKYEYWYYTLKAIGDRQIPLLLVSGIFRESQPFFKWYGSLHRQILEFFTHFFVQTQASAQLLQSFTSANKISVAGDTRFDSVIKMVEDWQSNFLVEQWLEGSSAVVVAGSTWPSDEEEIVHFAKTNPGIKWIIAPHHVDAESLKDTRRLFQMPVLFTDLPLQKVVYPLPNVLVINNVGMLRYLYKYGTICYVGGGFTGDGIHNVLEAAVYGKPVVHGPEFSKYPEAQGLLDAGASFVIESALELEKTLNMLFSDATAMKHAGDAAAHFVYQHEGATNTIVSYIQEKRLLTNEKKR